MHGLVMPVRTLDYLLMGIIAGAIAGLILVYIGGITIYAVIQAAQSIKGAFKMP
ncbi:MAG: hypothetical protein WC634_05900 [archaeon]